MASADRSRRRGLVLALALLALTASGCESTAEKSARLAKRFHRVSATQHGLDIAHTSREVSVVDAFLIHDANGTAAVLRLRSKAAHSLRAVPIAITLRDRSGQIVYRNDSAGLEASLTSLALLPAHRSTEWVDDQIPAGVASATLTALVGEALASTAPAPRLQIEGAHLLEDPANGNGVQGALTNHSSTAQQNVVIVAVARKGTKVVAAGRAILATLPAGASSPFQIFFIGDPTGAHLSLSASADAA